jgi:hypothetical protein
MQAARARSATRTALLARERPATHVEEEVGPLQQPAAHGVHHHGPDLRRHVPARPGMGRVGSARTRHTCRGRVMCHVPKCRARRVVRGADGYGWSWRAARLAASPEALSVHAAEGVRHERRQLAGLAGLRRGLAPEALRLALLRAHPEWPGLTRHAHAHGRMAHAALAFGPLITRTRTRTLPASLGAFASARSAPSSWCLSVAAAALAVACAATQPDSRWLACSVAAWRKPRTLLLRRHGRLARGQRRHGASAARCGSASARFGSAARGVCAAQADVGRVLCCAAQRGGASGKAVSPAQPNEQLGQVRGQRLVEQAAGGGQLLWTSGRVGGA